MGWSNISHSKHIKTIAVAVGLVVCLLFTACGITSESKYDRIWKVTRDYPLKYGDAEFADWDKHPFEEMKEILDPPEELLDSLTPEELTRLFLSYPLFPYMPWFGDYEVELFFGTYEGYSSIARRFMEREDRFELLMQAYKDIVLDTDIEMFELQYGRNDVAAWAENIIIDYVLAYGAEFTEKERALYEEIRDERYEKYYSKMADTTDELCMWFVVFDKYKSLPHRKGFAR